MITSHGVCPGCDNTFSAERLMFVEQCKAYEDEFMDLINPDLFPDVIDVIEYEVEAFYHLLWEKGVAI